MTLIKKIGVFFGGVSGEHEVSIVSALSVISALESRGYEIIKIGISKTGRWIVSNDADKILKGEKTYNRDKFAVLSTDPENRGIFIFKTSSTKGTIIEKTISLDFIFPVLHGSSGENGVMQGLFELSGIPYAGCRTAAGALCMDKVVSKKIFKEIGLKTLPDVSFTRSQWQNDKQIIINQAETLGYNLFIKPANTGSSVGITKAHNREELISGIETAARYDFKIIVEKAVDNAREIETAILGNDDPLISIPGEIKPGNEFYDYAAKYENGTSNTIIPANLSQEQTENIRKQAKKAYAAMGCGGLSRIDFLLDPKTKEIYINEINTMPGFTPISMYAKLWEASGIPYVELLDKIIESGVRDYEETRKNSSSFAPKTDWFKI